MIDVYLIENAECQCIFKDYIFQQVMKKANNGQLSLRHANSYKEPRKEDHFSYFQSLEQKLLQQSDKITSLIGMKSLSALETRSVNEPGVSRHKNSESEIKALCDSIEDFQRDSPRKQKGSTIIQNYLQNKKSSLNGSKSQFFQSPKEKQSQIQRKLTYNMVQPPDEVFVPQNNSPSKSQKVAERLKKTASSTGSSAAIMKTINKIKRMNTNSSQISSQNDQKQKSMSIDDFQVLKYLEEGQFGTVYLSRHKATNFICAIKKIPKSIFEGQFRFINQLLREIKIQSFLDHPNIVQLYSFFADEDNLYLILELCCGGNVYTNLRSQGRFPQEKVKNITRQVSHAIEFMHDSDIIHRDIKPENILLHEGIVKVCDFGWSIHSPLLRETRCGTPLYSSPEVIQKQQYDNKIDVWNIGIFTYQLIYGRVPFEIRTEEDLVKVVDEEIYFPKSIPVTSQAKDFILKCLVKNPKERLPMSRLVDHEFVASQNN